MQLDQRFELAQPPATAWSAFRDLALLVECLPGASLTGPMSNGVAPLRFDVKLGPVAAGFVGTAQASFDDATCTGRFEGSAADRKTGSRVKGSADLALSASAGGTLVAVRLDYALSGSLAQFGRAGIVRELASALTARFAANLERRLAASTDADAAAPSASVDDVRARVPAMPSASHGPVAPLSAIALIAAALRARLARIARRFGLGPSLPP